MVKRFLICCSLHIWKGSDVYEYNGAYAMTGNLWSSNYHMIYDAHIVPNSCNVPSSNIFNSEAGVIKLISRLRLFCGDKIGRYTCRYLGRWTHWSFEVIKLSLLVKILLDFLLYRPLVIYARNGWWGTREGKTKDQIIIIIIIYNFYLDTCWQTQNVVHK